MSRLLAAAYVLLNDPKLSDGRGGHDACMVGGKAVAEAGGMTNPPVRCSAWLGDSGRIGVGQIYGAFVLAGDRAIVVWNESAPAKSREEASQRMRVLVKILGSVIVSMGRLHGEPEKVIWQPLLVGVRQPTVDAKGATDEVNAVDVVSAVTLQDLRNPDALEESPRELLQRFIVGCGANEDMSKHH